MTPFAIIAMLAVDQTNKVELHVIDLMWLKTPEMVQGALKVDSCWLLYVSPDPTTCFIVFQTHAGSATIFLCMYNVDFSLLVNMLGHILSYFILHRLC